MVLANQQRVMLTRQKEATKGFLSLNFVRRKQNIFLLRDETFLNERKTFLIS